MSTDDMEIAPDFFDYFEAGAALLDSDKYASFFFRKYNITTPCGHYIM